MKRALFADLIFNEEGQPAREVRVGDVPHYAVPDGDFLRHVEAEFASEPVSLQTHEGSVMLCSSARWGPTDFTSRVDRAVAALNGLLARHQPK